MSGTLLLTGATGALGVPLLSELLRARTFDCIIALSRADSAALNTALLHESPGLDLATLSCVNIELGTAHGEQVLATLPSAIDCVIHAAACTKFRAPTAQLTQANVEGTRQILAWAATLPRAPRVLHFSTTCVAGQRTGEIAEAPLPEERGFVNDYERTKWQAEQLVAASPLRPELVRLATVVGSAHDGHLQRPGAFHTTLRWLHGGLLPMVPGDATTRLDLLPTELVTGFVSRLLARPAEPGGIYHVSSGARGVPLGELLDFAAQKFSARSAAWRGGQVLPPVLATRAAFEDFRATIFKTRDFLFNQVLESVDSFLPELFYPKRYATTSAEAAWGGPLPLPDWREWVGGVIDYALDTDFGRKEISAARP
jgi:nucleoside-diphosphate-sugar epimerase